MDASGFFKIKNNADGTCRYKARLVAKGFTQKHGEDYESKFAPVAKQSTFRILLAIAAARKLNIRHYDVKTAFLNGDIDEELYMSQPEGYIIEKGVHLVCKSKKSIYSLKQSAKAWNIKINDVLLKHGFNKSVADQCLYTKLHNDRTYMYALTYVDDLLIIDASEEEIK